MNKNNIRTAGTLLFEVRERFYPGWWTVTPPTTISPSTVYRVTCDSLDDCALAFEARPEEVRAIFGLSESSEKRLHALMEKHSQGKLHGKLLSELEDLTRAAQLVTLENARQLLEVPKAA